MVICVRVLVACEFSGIVRDAFARRGHDAWSCDILPTEQPGNHFQDDVLNHLNDSWDLMIAHPPCTYLCNSGVRWLHTGYSTLPGGRWDMLQDASLFFRTLLDADIKRICIENPIPHKYGKLPKYTQIVHPWQFGHGETKTTCLWLKGLPLLQPTKIVSGRKNRIHFMPPSKTRSKDRSITYTGIAEAMAEQWG